MNFLLPWAKAKWNLIYFPFSAKKNIYIFYVLQHATLKSTNTTQYERDLILFNFILILFSQPLKINWLFFNLLDVICNTIRLNYDNNNSNCSSKVDGEKNERRKRINFFSLRMGKRRLFSHFGSAIINFIVRTFFSSCTKVGLVWMRAKVFFTTIATILLQYDTFKENISILWSTVWMYGRWTMAHIYKNIHSKSKTYCGGYETSLNGLRKFFFVFMDFFFPFFIWICIWIEMPRNLYRWL